MTSKDQLHNVCNKINFQFLCRKFCKTSLYIKHAFKSSSLVTTKNFKISFTLSVNEHQRYRGKIVLYSLQKAFQLFAFCTVCLRTYMLNQFLCFLTILQHISNSLCINHVKVFDRKRMLKLILVKFNLCLLLALKFLHISYKKLERYLYCFCLILIKIQPGCLSFSL